MMEKRRRARINASLEQLKKLVLDATRRDVSTTRIVFKPPKFHLIILMNRDGRISLQL